MCSVVEVVLVESRMVEFIVKLSHHPVCNRLVLIFHSNDRLSVVVSCAEVPSELVISLRAVGRRIRLVVSHSLLSLASLVTARLLGLIVHVCEVDIVLVIRADSTLEKFLPRILFGCLLELTIVEVAFPTFLFKVEEEASLMETVVNFRSSTFENDKVFVQGVTFIECGHTRLIVTTSKKSLVNVTLAKVALQILE